MEQDLKIRTAAWVAGKAVHEQWEKILARHRLELNSAGLTDSQIEEACLDILSDSRRRVLDPLTVGYAVGLATRSLMMNGVSVDERVTEQLLDPLDEKLSVLFPNIETVTCYLAGTYRLSAGLL